MLYDIDVHIAFPGTIFSPGYENENKTKPKVTLKIEETDGGSPTEVVAAAILKGVYLGSCQHARSSFCVLARERLLI